MTDVDLVAAAAPRSDQLNADDLIGGPRVVTIAEVRKGNSEQPVEIVTAEFGPGRPYRPGKSMIRVLIEVWGPKSGTYVGRRLGIYRDPDITFGPNKVGGIRISHMSNLDKPKSIPLTKTRGKKELFRVEPLPEASPANGSRATEAEIKALVDGLAEGGITDPKEAIPFLRTRTGRPEINKSTDLTSAEIAAVLDFMTNGEPE